LEIVLMRLHFGSDHAAIELRRHLGGQAEQAGHSIASEIGPTDPEDKADYPDVAIEVARRVLADPGSLGVLACGTGQGMAMTANRIRGIRAAVCSDPYSAAMARRHNDANILCVGGRVIGPGVAESVLEAFVTSDFEGGRHARRVEKLDAAG
jgi:ribose 5-phosphate isomerase B